jgi:hypothetical protein
MGDAQRTWFPEMVAELRRRWRPGLSFPEMIALRDEFDAMVHHIRSTRHIRTPVIRCPNCGRVGRAAEPEVSIRSMIIALAKFSITSAEDAKTLEMHWAIYRKANGLDLHGKAVESAGKVKQRCGHDSDAQE